MANKKLLYLSYLFTLLAALVPLNGFIFGFNSFSLLARIPILNILYFTCHLGMIFLLALAIAAFVIAFASYKKERLTLVQKVISAVFVCLFVLLIFSYPYTAMFCVYSSL